MSQTSHGKVLDVTLVSTGDQVIDDTPAGTTVLYLHDVSDFNESVDGGQITLGWEGTSTIYTYTSRDDVNNTLTLTAGTAVAYTDDGSQDGRVFVYPPSEEKWAMVLVDDISDSVLAQIPHALQDRFELGVRSVEVNESETVSLTERDGVWYIDNIEAMPPMIDGSYIDPQTLPIPQISDGVPPASSPAPTIRAGVGSIFVTWTPVSNADAVTYDVYVSTVSGFTPDSSTLVASALGVGPAVIRTLANGTRVVSGTTYYVKVIARDEDGSAAASAEASGTPATVVVDEVGTGAITTTKIADDAITTPKILAGAITAAKIAANTITANEIAANAITSDELAANSVIAGKIAASSVTATEIAAGAVTAVKLTIGAATDNKVINGSFESGSEMWATGSGGSNGSWSIVTGTGGSGVNALQITRGAGANQMSVGQVSAAYFPVNGAAARPFHATCRAKSVTFDYASGFFLRIRWYQADKVTPASVSSSDPISNAGITTNYQAFQGQATPPANAAWGRAEIIAGTALDSATIHVDAIEVREVTTSTQIENGAITTSKLSATAIDGMTITGALIRTAASGKRWEIQAGGTNELTSYSGLAGEIAPGGLQVDAEGGLPVVRLYAPKLVDNDVQASLDLFTGTDGYSFSSVHGNQTTLYAEFINPSNTSQNAAATVQAHTEASNAVIDLTVTQSGGGSNLQLVNGGLFLDLDNNASSEVYFTDVGHQILSPSGSIHLEVGDSEITLWEFDNQGISHKINNTEVFRAAQVNSQLAAGSVNAPVLDRYRVAARTATTGVFATLSWDGNRDTRGIGYSGDTATISVSGTYSISAGLAFNANVTGRRIIRLLHNGTEIARDERDAGGATPRNVAIHRTRDLEAGDTLKIEFWQNSGGNLDLDVTQKYTYFNLAWMGWGKY